jgi:hypothetical protein
VEIRFEPPSDQIPCSRLPGGKQYPGTRQKPVAAALTPDVLDAMHPPDFLYARKKGVGTKNPTLEQLQRDSELAADVDSLEAYEVNRWPLGKEPGGKG